MYGGNRRPRQRTRGHMLVKVIKSGQVFGHTDFWRLALYFITPLALRNTLNALSATIALVYCL